MKRLGGSVLLAVIVAMSAPQALDAQRGGGGRGGGGRGGGRGGAMHGPPTAPPRSATQGISVDHPLPGDLNTVRPAPVLGFGPPPQSPFTARPGTYTRQRRPGSYGSSIGYGYGYGFSTDYGDYPPREPRGEAVDEDSALLFLDVTPASAQVFADTAFVGSVEDLMSQGVRLSPGHHWIDLEATGYEKKTLDVTLRAGEPLRYRVDLAPARSAALVVIPPHPPQTMYAIPGCYGGNRPPVAANLPKGCDIAKVRVIRPQQ